MGQLEPVFLVMVTENNNNKYYNMFPKSDDTFLVEYGRIEGGRGQSKLYPMSKWKSQLASKLRKGYIDRTNLMQDIIEDSKVEEDDIPIQDKFSVISVQSIRDVLKRLYNYANNLVQSSYKAKASTITQAMVDSAQEQVDYISSNYKDWDIKTFNQELLKLWAIIPRKMSDTRDYLANDIESFDKIVVKEQETLDALAGMVYKKKSSVEKCENDTQNDTEKCVGVSSILIEMGIEMEETDEHEDEMLKKLMGDVKSKFYKAWRVNNQETDEKFRAFQEKYHLDNVKLCCHGSRNTNWFNILKTGLKLRPSNVAINGKMFGMGTYYSNPDKYEGGVKKSIGYTSLSGAYWTGESDNCGFIAFYEVALGKPYDVYSFNSEYYNMDLKKLKQKDPEAWHLWAHGNTAMLRNDELVVYTEEQMTIRYLVEIR